LSRLIEDGKEATRITLLGVWSNIGLGMIKAIIGFFTNSASLIADAAHNLSDTLSDVVTLLALRLSRRPSDEKHPYGYGKFEPIGTLCISVFLCLAAVGIATHSINLIISPTSVMAASQKVLACGFGIAAFSVFVKELLYRWTVQVGIKTKSQILITNAWHHRADAASAFVALLGIGGSLVGIQLIDGVCGLVVCGMIMKMGVVQAWEALSDLTDRNVVDKFMPSIHHALAPLMSNQGSGIVNIHNVRGRKMGPYSVIDLHVQVNPMMSVSAAYQLGERVRKAILSHEPEISEVLLHLDSGDEDGDNNNSYGDKCHVQIEEKIRQVLLGRKYHNNEVGSMANTATEPPHDGETREENQFDIEGIEGIEDVAHVVPHFVMDKVLVEVQIVVEDNPDLTLRYIQQIAANAKNAIESRLPDLIDEVHVDLELSRAHQFSAVKLSQSQLKTKTEATNPTEQFPKQQQTSQ